MSALEEACHNGYNKRDALPGINGDIREVSQIYVFLKGMNP